MLAVLAKLTVFLHFMAIINTVPHTPSVTSEHERSIRCGFVFYSCLDFIKVSPMFI